MTFKENNPEKKREEIMEDLVSKGIFKIDGKQLYELNLCELMKEYITKEE